MRGIGEQKGTLPAAAALRVLGRGAGQEVGLAPESEQVEEPVVLLASVAVVVVAAVWLVMPVTVVLVCMRVGQQVATAGQGCKGRVGTAEAVGLRVEKVVVLAVTALLRSAMVAPQPQVVLWALAAWPRG